MNQSFELLVEGRTLRGMMSIPDRVQTTKFPIVVMFPGIDGTRVGPQRLFYLLARDLETIGVASLRIDLTGQGDSDGDFEHITPRVHEEDGQAIVRHIQTDQRLDNNHIILLGISNGALTAITCVSNELLNIKRLILLSPTFNISQVADKILSKIPETATRISFYGHQTSRSSVLAFTTYDLAKHLKAYQGSTLLITGSRDSLVPQEIYADFKTRVLPHPWVHHELDGAGHLFEHINWQQEVRRLVVEHLRDMESSNPSS